MFFFFPSRVILVAIFLKKKILSWFFFFFFLKKKFGRLGRRGVSHVIGTCGHLFFKNCLYNASEKNLFICQIFIK